MNAKYLVRLKLTKDLKDAGVGRGDLDELVHDCADNLATDINNAGFGDQVSFLLETGWSGEIEQLLVDKQAEEDTP